MKVDAVFTKKALSLNHTGTIHHSYDPDASPTMKPLVTTPKSTFRIDYADGSWAKGDVVLVKFFREFIDIRILSTLEISWSKVKLSRPLPVHPLKCSIPRWTVFLVSHLELSTASNLTKSRLQSKT